MTTCQLDIVKRISRNKTLSLFIHHDGLYMNPSSEEEGVVVRSYNEGHNGGQCCSVISVLQNTFFYF